MAQIPRTSRYDRDTVDELVHRVGPRALVDMVFAYWPRTSQDPLLGFFSLEAWSERSQSYELRLMVSGRSHPVPAEVADLYIGEGSRQLDDPLIELLFLNEFDPTRFLVASRGLHEPGRSAGSGPPRGHESRGPAEAELRGSGRAMRRVEPPRGRPAYYGPPEGYDRRTPPARRPDSGHVAGSAAGRRSDRGGGEPELPPEMLKRIEALEKSRVEAKSHASASEYAAAELGRM